MAVLADSVGTRQRLNVVVRVEVVVVEDDRIGARQVYAKPAGFGADEVHENRRFVSIEIVYSLLPVTQFCRTVQSSILPIAVSYTHLTLPTIYSV